MPRSQAQVRKSAYAERETSLTQAISHLREHPEATYRGVAHLFGLNKGTLKNRLEGKTKAFNRAHERQQEFDQEEEERIAQWVKELDDMGVSPRHHHVEEMMRAILVRWGSPKDNTQREVGKHLIQRIINRHPEVSAPFANTTNRECALASDPRVFNYFFNSLSETRSRYQIKPHNLWNFDEKCFLLGVVSKEQVLCPSDRKNPRVRQNGAESRLLSLRVYLLLV